jgi:hypothetical protein
MFRDWVKQALTIKNILPKQTSPHLIWMQATTSAQEHYGDFKKVEKLLNEAGEKLDSTSDVGDFDPFMKQWDEWEHEVREYFESLAHAVGSASISVLKRDANLIMSMFRSIYNDMTSHVAGDVTDCDRVDKMNDDMNHLAGMYSFLHGIQ